MSFHSLYRSSNYSKLNKTFIFQVNYQTLNPFELKFFKTLTYKFLSKIFIESSCLEMHFNSKIYHLMNPYRIMRGKISHFAIHFSHVVDFLWEWDSSFNTYLGNLCYQFYSKTTAPGAKEIEDRIGLNFTDIVTFWNFIDTFRLTISAHIYIPTIIKTFVCLIPSCKIYRTDFNEISHIYTCYRHRLISI